jgi:hypothetical protein
MGGTPWDKYKTPEVVSEGGPWAKYGNMSPREVVDALPSFLTRTADEKAEDKRNADNRAFIGALPQPDSLVGQAGTFSGQYLNSTTFGQIDNLNAAIDSGLGIGPDQSFSDRKSQSRDNRQDLREANPVSGLAGDITGYLAPGTAAWKSLSALGKSIPGAAALSNTIAQTGRVPAWLQRIAGSAGLFTADAAVFGATVGASNEEAAAGRDLTLSERGKVGVDYAKANLGEMADGLGVEVPSWARGIPVSAVFPMAGSLAERSIKGISTGGRTITPDRVAGETLQSIGRAPTQSAAREMADVLDGEPITGSTIKTFRFIENALRDAGKSAGLSKDAIRNRIADGFDSIRQSLPAVADGRTPLSVLIEREFAKDFGPTVAENFRKFLLKVGLDDPGVTRNFIDDFRTGQADEYLNTIDQNLGGQSAIDFEQALDKGLETKIKYRQKVIDKAKAVGNDGPLADSLREHMIDSEFKGMLAGEAKNRGWADVDTFIQKDPWNAANKLQSEIGRAESKAFNAGNTVQYSKMHESKQFIQDFLGLSDKTGLPGYNRLTGQIASESRVRDNLGYVDGFGKDHPGFGPDLRKASGSTRKTEAMRKRYEGQTPQDKAAHARLPKEAQDKGLERSKAAARISTAEMLKDELRGLRPGGVDVDGQDVFGFRLTQSQKKGMMSGDERLPGALPAVFGEAGQNIADWVNRNVELRKFLADIDPNTGSNTANKLNAFATGDDAITPALGRSLPEGSTSANALADVLLFTSGIPPVATLMQKAPGWLQAPFRPSRAARAEVANALLRQPARRGPLPPAPAPVSKLTGHSNPKWDKDPRWDDPNLTGKQNPPPNSGQPGPDFPYVVRHEGGQEIGFKTREEAEAFVSQDSAPVAQNGLFGFGRKPQQAQRPLPTADELAAAEAEVIRTSQELEPLQRAWNGPGVSNANDRRALDAATQENQRALAKYYDMRDRLEAAQRGNSNSLPMLNNPTVGGAVAGGMAGGSMAQDLDGDGRVSMQERYVQGSLGALGGGFGGRAIGKLDDRMISQGSRQVLEGRAAPMGAGSKGSLPMDEASRMARARDMGFDTEQTLYHGSPAGTEIEQIVPSRSGEFGPGAYLTDFAPSAHMWGSRGGTEAQILPAHVRGKMYKTTKQEWLQRLQTEGPDGELPTPRELQAELKAQGYEGIEAVGLNGQDVQIVIFDPKNIRSKYATFDPAQSDSPVLTAGIGGRTRKDVMKDVLPKSQGARVLGTSKPLPMKGEAKHGGSTTTDRAVDAAALGVASGGFVGPADAEGVNYEAEFASVEQDLQRAQGERQATLQRLQAAQDELAAWNARFNAEDRDVKAIQTFLRDNVNPDLAVDGDPRGQTATANQQYISRLEQAIIAQQEALAKNDAMVQSATQRRADLEERQVYDQTAPNPAWDFVRDKLPWVGAAAGIAAGYRTRRGNMRKNREKADAIEGQVEGLLAPNRGSSGLTKDANAVNQIWELGGSGENVPFRMLLSGAKQGQPAVRKGAADLANLFPKGPNWNKADFAASALWGLEGSAGYATEQYAGANLEKAEARLRALQDAPKKDLAAIKKASSDVQMWKSIQAAAQFSKMLGMYGAGGSLLLGAKERLPMAQPPKNLIANKRSSTAQRIQKRDQEHRDANR